MSTNRGIFESFPNQPAPRPDSPFAVAQEPAAEPASASSPFTAAARPDSPFTVVDDAADAKPVEPGKPAKLPERRKADSPFQVAEPSEGFGFEAPQKSFGSSPFEASGSASAPVAASPFSAPAQPVASPFSAEPQRGPSTTTQAAIAAFGSWQDSQAATPAPQATPQTFEQAAQAVPSTFAPPVQVPSAFSPAPQSATQASTPAPAPVTPAPAAAPTAAPAESSYSDSYSIRQLELRAIFGVDREMSIDEILQRSRALPGMKNIARVGEQDMATIEALKSLLPNLGFGNGGLKLFAGSVPLEFVREGSVMLAVQTDGGFAPGVRETLMIVARELGRTA